MCYIVKTTTIDRDDFGGWPTIAVALCEMSDGTFEANTRTESKCFKTYAGAVRWLARRGYEVPAAA